MNYVNSSGKYKFIFSFHVRNESGLKTLRRFGPEAGESPEADDFASCADQKFNHSIRVMGQGQV